MTQKRQKGQKYGNPRVRGTPKRGERLQKQFQQIKKDGQKIDQHQETQNENKTKKITKKERIEAKRKHRIEKLRQVKGEVKGQLTAAQSSTKSMGKFDRKAHQQERKLKPKRRKQHSSFHNLQQQVERNLEVFNMVKNSQGSKKVEHSL